MSKHGVIGIGYQDIIRPIPFKKHLLLFDKLLVVDETLKIAHQLTGLASKGKNFDGTHYAFNNQTIEVLEKNDLLRVVKFSDPVISDMKPYEKKSKVEVQADILELK